MQKLKSGFKGKITWNKYQLKTEPLNTPNPYLDLLINPSFQGVNTLFVLSFNALDNRAGYSIYYLPTAKVQNYNVMIDRKNFFDQPVDNYIKT